ncbi:hypothetical protein, unknown function [Leishmania tarentolae]|uniref:Uncharacterized protein n=1 Tax=Leishmania tarentolae TaxID=5689 RepID=A0A640KAR1_LEITA|nr:hypothetical protein, unknown function [Leishmania tarentolae]
MPLKPPSGPPPPQVNESPTHVVDSPQRLPNRTNGTAARTRAVAASALWNGGDTSGTDVAASAHSCYESKHICSALAQAHARHAHPFPSPVKAHPLRTGLLRPPSKLRQASADILVTVPAAASTKVSSDGLHATDHVHSRTQARQPPPQLTQLSGPTADRGRATASAKPLLSVLPPWVQLDIAAFDSRSFSADTVPIAGSGEGGLPWGLATSQNRITTPQHMQADRTRGSTSRSYLHGQQHASHEQQSSSPQVCTDAGGVSMVDASSFTSSPLFEWVPYDGWNDSDLCQGQRSGRSRRDASGWQSCVTQRLGPRDLSGPLAAMESGAATSGQTQSPGDAGGSAMPGTVNANPAAPLRQRTRGATCGDLDAPQRALQQQQWYQRKASMPTVNASPLALRDTMAAGPSRSVWRNNHAEKNRGQGNGGGGGGGGRDVGRSGQEGFTITMATPPPLLSSTTVTQRTSPFRHFRFQHAIAAASPSSLGIPGAGSVAAAHRTSTSTGSAGPFFLPLEAVLSKALPVFRGGFSSRACSVCTGVRSDGTLCIVMLEEYPGYTGSTPAQPSRAFTSSPPFSPTKEEGRPTVMGAQEGYHATISPASQIQQGLTWPLPTASTEQPAFSLSAATGVPLEAAGTVPQSAAAGVAGMTGSTHAHSQDSIAIGDAVKEGASIRDPCDRLTSGSAPHAPQTHRPPPLPGSGESLHAASGGSIVRSHLGTAIETMNKAADAALRAVTTVGTVMPASTEQTHLSGCNEDTRRGPVPAVASSMCTTHVTDTAATERKSLPASARIMPSFTLFNPTELPTKDTTGASLFAPQGAGSGCGERDRQRTTSLLPAWCHAVAEALLAPLSPPKLPRPGQRRRTTTAAATASMTVERNIHSRRWSVEARREIPIAWNAKFLAAAERGSVPQRTAAAASAVDSRRRSRVVERKDSWAIPLSDPSHVPPRESAVPDVTVLGNANPTGPQLSPPAPLNTTIPTSPLLVSYSSKPDGIDGGRGIVRVVAEANTVDFDARDAPHAYTQLLIEVDTKHATTTSTAIGSGDVRVTAAVATAAREQVRTPKVHLSDSTTLFGFQGYHQRRRERSEAVANQAVDYRVAGSGAPVVAVPTMTAEGAKNNVEDTWRLNYSHARAADASVPPTPFRRVGATWAKRGGHVSTAAPSIDSAALPLRSDGAQPHTRTCRLPVSASPHTVAQLTMLAPSGTDMMVQEHANEHPSQRRHSPVGCSAGAAAAASTYSSHKNSAYIMGGCANTGSLRVGDVETTLSSAALATTSDILVTPAGAMEPSAIMRSRAVPVSPAGDSEGGVSDGGDVAHSSEALVNTSQNTRFKDADNRDSLAIYAETVPRFHMLQTPIERAPACASPLASPLQNLPEQQQPQGSFNVLRASNVSRVPRRPLAQYPPKLGRPAGHTAGCDV